MILVKIMLAAMIGSLLVSIFMTLVAVGIATVNSIRRYRR